MALRLAAALVAGLVYVNALHNPFVYDDYRTVVTNASIVPPLSLRAVVLNDVKRPVVNASYAFDRSVSGAQPFGFHVTNTLLHMLNVVLLFELAQLLMPRWGAFAAAVLFAVHPMMTESVGYVSGRSELLCATGVLAALVCAVRWMRGGGAHWAAWSIGLWIPALLSKETAAMLPFVVAACDWLTSDDREGARRRMKAFHAPLMTVAIVTGIARLIVLATLERGGSTAFHPELIPLAADVVVRYLTLMMAPSGQTLFHAVMAVPTFFAPRALVAFAVLGGTIAVAWALRRTAGVVSFGLLTFLLFLVPAAALTIANVGEPMAEHRVYLASVGLFLAAGSAIERLSRRAATATKYGSEITGAMVAVVVLAFALETVVRNAVWSDPVALWQESASLAPYHPRPRMLLGEALEDAGRRAEALPQYQDAVRLGPSDPVAHLKLGLCLAALGQFEPARAALRETIRLDPDNEPARRGLALLEQIKPAT